MKDFLMPGYAPENTSLQGTFRRSLGQLDLGPDPGSDPPGTGADGELSRLPALDLLRALLDRALILPEEWTALPQAKRDRLQKALDSRELLDALVGERLLTDYQAKRIRADKAFGLVLGNYRVLDRIGVGGMGIVYRAEHTRMRRQVAIKVLTLLGDQNARIAQRFFSEMRIISRLQHPNIVSAIDAGEARSADPDAPVLHYFVMELVEGRDLQEIVAREGPMAPARACALIYQVAAALVQAHKLQLVHRDIKPSNILVTAEDQAKLLDFGLARHFTQRLTEPGVVMGSIDYLAPEQARDSRTVDIRADLYALGGTLFWCLTGQTPFRAQPNIAHELALRQTQGPPALHALRADMPIELDAVIARMMASNPDERYATPEAVMRALLPFLWREAHDYGAPAARQTGLPHVASAEPDSHPNRVLIVDDEKNICTVCRAALQSDKLDCETAAGGTEALALLAARPFDLVLLDIDMPGMSGLEVVRRLRQAPPCRNLKIIMISGRATSDDMANLLLAGADDFISKPLSLIQLMARVKAALNHKRSEDRSELLNRQLLTANTELEGHLAARARDLIQFRNTLVSSLDKLVGRCNDGDRA